MRNGWISTRGSTRRSRGRFTCKNKQGKWTQTGTRRSWFRRIGSFSRSLDRILVGLLVGFLVVGLDVELSETQ